MRYCSHNILDSSFTFSDLSSIEISMFPAVGQSGLLIIPQTSSTLSNKLALADVVRTQRYCVAKFSNILWNPPA